MSKVVDKLILDFIKRQFHPYDTHDAFSCGFSAYQAGDCRNPHEADSISAQAWTKGVQAAINYKKATAC